MKLEVGKFYKTRGGDKARIYAVDAGGDYPVHGAVYCPAPHPGNSEWEFMTWCPDGSYYGNEDEDRLDIIAEWHEPVTRTVWVNMYRQFTSIWESRVSADQAAGFAAEAATGYMGERLACVRVELKEGVFDE